MSKTFPKFEMFNFKLYSTYFLKQTKKGERAKRWLKLRFKFPRGITPRTPSSLNKKRRTNWERNLENGHVRVNSYTGRVYLDRLIKTIRVWTRKRFNS